MADIKIDNLKIDNIKSINNEAGSELFIDSESFMDELERDDSLNILGGFQQLQGGRSTCSCNCNGAIV